MRFLSLTVIFVVAACALPSPLRAEGVGTAFTYQGSLENGTGPVTDTCDFRFGLWDEGVDGSQCGASPLLYAGVAVSNGQFTTVIDFGAGAIDGTARWLEIEVKCPSDADFVLLSPRVELTPVPHALALPGLYTQENAISPNVIGGYKGNIVGSGVVGANIGGGGFANAENQATADYATVGGGEGNVAAGPHSTIAGGGSLNLGVYICDDLFTYCGVCVGGVNDGGLCTSTDNCWDGVCQADNSQCSPSTCNLIPMRRCLRGPQIGTDCGKCSGTSDVCHTDETCGGIGLCEPDDAVCGVSGACGSLLSNVVEGAFGTIGGGYGNHAGTGAVVSGGAQNLASSPFSTIGGGVDNHANEDGATVGGGVSNFASGDSSMIAGGLGNRAGGYFSTVAGGQGNRALGEGGSVVGGAANAAIGFCSASPGGFFNSAGGDFSFAAGRMARVRDAAASGDADGDQGTFVWADSTDDAFTSTGPSQFLIRASGGVGIGTNAPAAQLDVNGAAKATTIEITGGAPFESPLMAWGDNTNGQLDFPPETFTAVAGAETHSIAIRADGTLAAWGSNDSGQTNVPMGTFNAVSTKSSHVLAIRSDGTLAAWGDNGWGQIDVSPGTYTGVAAGTQHSAAIRSDGMLAGWGDNSFGQTNVPAGTFSAIAAGQYHSVAIRDDGTLAAWGDNSNGQLDVPSGTFMAIAAGTNHSVAIRTDSTLAAWGDNSSGQLDVPSGTFIVIAAGELHSLAIRSDGTLAGWGSNNEGQIDVPAGMYSAVAAGWYHSLAIRSSPPTPDPALRLHADSAFKPGSNTWTIYSDRRLKKNITPLSGALDHLLQLRGVTFHWRDPASQGGITGTQMGLIADEVQRVFPQWVGRDPKGYQTLTVGGFEALTAEAIRELREEKDRQIGEKDCEIENLKSEISNFKFEISELKELVRELGKGNEAARQGGD